MALNIRKATIWKTETRNSPGAMAATLGPLADHGVNLDLVMGYTNADKSLATVEVFPIAARKSRKTATDAGFREAEFPCVVVRGDNRPGLGRQISAAFAQAGINLNFFIAQAVDHEYVGLFSFEAQSEADLAVRVLKAALKEKAPAKRPIVRKSARSRPLKVGLKR